MNRGGSGFPFDLPAMATIDRFRLDQPVTLLAGDNGSGKSTILDAVAAAIGFAEQGGELERLGELPDAFDEDGITRAGYDELDAVRLMRGFFEAPERYLRAIEAGPD